IVFSGKMSYHANTTAALHFVHEIYPAICEHCPQTRLRIVGSSPPKSIRSLAREPGITVSGYVSDMAASLSRAAVAVCPVTVKVGIQNKILEAMALEVPVVTTPEGANGLNAIPGRDFLVGATPREFAAEVCRLLQS